LGNNQREEKAKLLRNKTKSIEKKKCCGCLLFEKNIRISTQKKPKFFSNDNFVSNLKPEYNQ